MSDERRDGTRMITELSVTLRAVKGGEVIDERATAHDISTNGFRVETQAQMTEKTLIAFTMDLPGGERASGSGRVVWASRESWATWAGIEITSMSWSDKRRLTNLLHPPRVDWSGLSKTSTKLLIALVVITAAHRLLYSPIAQGVLAKMAPKIIALAVMWWALSELLKKERR
ncbi:MAG: PilZ domain-containing protein [Elusimicrobia bacterium]|nr:PilZ domain-containing protein [Elusimicrobiota bacterium]